MNTSPQQHHIPTHSQPLDNHKEKSRQFKGIRMRKWGKWVAEVRMPNSRAKIWLGSYDAAEQAARAFDAAVYCLRGADANFNFPDTVPAIPSASSLSRQQIQRAAAKYARGQISSTNINNNPLTEAAEPRPISSCISETEAVIDIPQIYEEPDFELLESLFEDGNRFFNSEKFPSLDASTLELTSSTERQGPTELPKMAQISSQKCCTGRCTCTTSSLE